MLRTLFICVWIGALSFGSIFAGAYWKRRPLSSGSEQVKEKLEVRKVKPITAPVISGGALTGYVSAELSIVLTEEAAHDAQDIETYFLDEAFKVIYGENDLDFEHPQKINVDDLTKRMTSKANEKLGYNAIKETLVKDITFIPKESLPR